MRPYIIGVIATVVWGATGIACLLDETPPMLAVAGPAAMAAATPTSVSAVAVPQPGQSVVAEARIVPVRSAKLSFPLTGVPIAEVLVREGDMVAKGAPLVRLDTRALQLAVEEARAGIARVRADYDKLREGAPAADIAQAEAHLSQIQARLTQAYGRVTPQDVAAAEARLKEARARLAGLEAGSPAAEIEQARAALAEAQAEGNQQRAALAEAKEKARRLVEERANDIRALQATVSNAYWNLQRAGGDPEAPEAREPAAALERAKLDLANAESAFERAQVEYDAAKQKEIAGVAESEATISTAASKLNDLLAGTKPDELANAQAAVATAQADLARLQGAARGGELAEAAAAVTEANARVSGLHADASEASIAQVQVAILQSEVRLKAAELAIEQATLVAPIAGVVGTVNITPGEIADSHEPAVILADVSAWQLETQDLNDLSVARIHEGASVTISFYAIPQLELPGRVARVKPIGENEQGKTFYTVTIRPDRWDARLRWNMPALVTIKTTPQ